MITATSGIESSTTKYCRAKAISAVGLSRRRPLASWRRCGVLRRVWCSPPKCILCVVSQTSQVILRYSRVCRSERFSLSAFRNDNSFRRETQAMQNQLTVRLCECMQCICVHCLLSPSKFIYGPNLTDPDLYYPFDEVVDGQIVGSTPGMIGGDVSLVEGRVSRAVYTDGIQDQFVNLGNLRQHCVGDLRLCQQGQTISLWLRPHEKSRANSFTLQMGDTQGAP